jgi:hypothetical protein
MTTGEAIRQTQFWLDQHADWFSDAQVATALNRAVTEWVLRKYEAGLGTERNRRELGMLIPTPIERTGSRIALTAENEVWLILGVELQTKDDAGNFGLPVPCRPITRDAAAVAQRSVFHRPTATYPLYTTSRQTNGTGEQLDILSPSPPDKVLVHYIKRPMPLDVAKPEQLWLDIPELAQPEIIQIARRMLLQTVAPDYASQVQVEEPKSAAMAAAQ